MRALALPTLLFLLTAASPPELPRWKAQASHVTITRDDWGIAHIHGKTDADAVFGMIYAQAEDDFPRIEANYLTALGRTAEADGEKAIWQDLRARLYVSEAELKADYANSPPQMRRLMDAWADGLNYFLAAHPEVKPRVLTQFEPWMVMSFTEGSIGGDIERIDLKALQAFYSSSPRIRGEVAARSADGGVLGREEPLHQLSWSPSPAKSEEDVERQGSNGIAIAPKLTAAGNALLLINPHTSFYFRSEAQVSSDEGLNAYGAATWGQFFVYQGFNPHVGWMHTSSGVDNVDEFFYRIDRRGKGYCYWYGTVCRPLITRPITIRYRTSDGKLASRSFTTFRTHRGPIVRTTPVPRAGVSALWIAFAMMDRPVQALQQSYLRTKATDLASYMKISNLKANSSNNTVYADDRGNIAMLAPQFMPRRDNRFDYTRPVDGSDPATDWDGLHAVSGLPNTVNPPNGWVQNTNTWPYRAAGAYSPKASDFPRYMDRVGENYRGMHALQLLTASSGWTLGKLQAAAFDSYQPGFAALIPGLLAAYDGLPRDDARRASLAEPIGVLRGWNYRWSGASAAQTLAIFWGDRLLKMLDPRADEPGNISIMRMGRDTTSAQKLQALGDAAMQLRADFGRLQVPWGEVNRFQRLSNSIIPQFSDEAPSLPVPFASGKYGSLASIEMRVPKTTRHIFGNYGNSFVAVVEFTRGGPRARAVTAGGESGHPDSPHFNDEAQRYASGDLRPVYFTAGELKGHAERVYHPGE